MLEPREQIDIYNDLAEMSFLYNDGTSIHCGDCIYTITIKNVSTTSEDFPRGYTVTDVPHLIAVADGRDLDLTINPKTFLDVCASLGVPYYRDRDNYDGWKTGYITPVDKPA